MDRPEKLVEVVGQQRLADKVTNILDRIETELDEADTNIGQAMHLVDLDNDGLVRAWHRDLLGHAWKLVFSIISNRSGSPES